MLKNYFAVAWRTLWRRKGYTAINVGGLAVALACCFLIALFVRQELSYDDFHAEADRTYRLLRQGTEGEGRLAYTAAGYASDLKAAFPQIEAAVRVYANRDPYLETEERVRQAEGLALADSSFFEVFDGFRLLRGDPKGVLDAPQSLVLSESVAQGLFPAGNPVGKTVRYDGGVPLTVTGVMAEPPGPAHLAPDYLVPFHLMGEGALGGYTNQNYYTYFRLSEGTDPDRLEKQFAAFYEERPEGEDSPSSANLVLQPLASIHFDTGVRFDVAGNTDPASLWIFGGVALLVLLVAVANFANLATAQANQRAREVGVRKALGAVRGQLAGRFFGEAVLLAGLAVLLALALTRLALPFFADFVGGSAGAAAPAMGGLGALLLLVGIGLGAGLLAGAYPALYLSGFDPAQVLGGERTAGGRGAARLRQVLTAAQLAASVFLVVSALVAYQQLRHMQTGRLGFESEQVVFLPGRAVQGSYETFRQRLLESPSVEDVTQTSGLPGRISMQRSYGFPGAGEAQTSDFHTVVADTSYLETLGLNLKAGRDFSRASDLKGSYVINEAAARQLGWENPVGRRFKVWDREEMGTVIGVVEDFNFKSPRQRVEPLVFQMHESWGSDFVTVRARAGRTGAALEDMEAAWEALAPGYAFDYQFLNDDFGRLYASERRLGRLFALFAGLAICVACLGLIGLAAHAAERRTKEVAVRKALGASTRSVVGLLLKGFLKLALVGFAVAAPVAWLAASRWLEGFASRIDLGLLPFLAGGLLVVLVTLATAGTQALRAARMNPAQALRDE